MTRALLGGVWLCLVVFLCAHLAADWRTRSLAAARAEPNYFEGVSYEKTRPITVPIVRDGKVSGYVMAQFVYTAESEQLRTLRVPPESFILDETFQALFTNESIDFSDLRAFDMRAFLGALTQSVNARLGRPVVRELLVEEFAFLDPSQIR